MPLADRPQRVTLPTLQILAAFMADLSRDDWYGRAMSVHTALGSGTVLQCLYRLENWGWLESRWEPWRIYWIAWLTRIAMPRPTSLAVTTPSAKSSAASTCNGTTLSIASATRGDCRNP